MFTGIIEDVGKVENIRKTPGSWSIDIKTTLGDIKEGDSISVNGVCLTVKNIKDRTLSFDISPETLRVSNLKFLNKGDFVNLERALKVGDRLGGHLVQGHVDCTGIIRVLYKEGDHWRLKVWIPPEFKKFVIYKGSIAIDGISLTVNNIEGSLIGITIVPYTYENTILRYRKTNERVNIEFDLIGKYVLSLVKNV